MHLTKRYLIDRIRDVLTEDDLTVLSSPHKKTNVSVTEFATTRKVLYPSPIHHREHTYKEEYFPKNVWMGFKLFSSRNQGRGGSRIPRRRGRQPPRRGRQAYKFARFSQKLHEIKTTLVRRGNASGAPPSPLGSTTAGGSPEKGVNPTLSKNQ